MNSLDFNLRAIIERTSFLPPYFAVAQKALRLLGKEDLHLEELAAVLETDQALVSKLLGLVNSPFYGLSRQITQVHEALSFLGITETRNLVLAVSTKDVFSSQTDHDIWRHSLACAYLAEALAKYSRKGIDQNQAFTAGLIHDIGIAFINKKMQKAGGEIRVKIALGRSRLDAERSVLGMDHAQIGSIILRRWSVPEVIIQAVQYHHSPWAVENPLCPIIALANQVAAPNGPTPFDPNDRLLRFASISPGDLNSLYSATQVTISNFESRIAAG